MGTPFPGGHETEMLEAPNGHQDGLRGWSPFWRNFVNTVFRRNLHRCVENNFAGALGAVFPRVARKGPDVVEIDRMRVGRRIDAVVEALDFHLHFGCALDRKGP